MKINLEFVFLAIDDDRRDLLVKEDENCRQQSRQYRQYRQPPRVNVPRVHPKRVPASQTQYFAFFSSASL